MDYNPETNFCLSHPCHMTTNGMTFMIPFQGTFDDYKTLFYSNILDGDNIKGAEDNKNALTPLFSPEKDTISGDIPRFKGEEKIDAYRGKIMNVLINIDYVFDIIKQFFSQDQTNSVFLKAFVEQILSDMNKTLGNFNIFRFSYDDTSNCLQIIDDQLVPGLPEEVIVPKTSEYDIPIYGRDSIARSLDLRTDISSKMANVLAISANAEVQKQSANSVDGTPYGFINQSYKDRYISNRTENSNIIKKEDGKKTTTEATDAIVSSALKFNKNVTDFYGTYNPSTENIGHATNYYIEKFSVSKLAPPTRAAAMIPVSINFTLDGISGFNMMQGFTISEKFLPYTYNLRNSSKGSQKVGFMVTGNVHTIENNEWTTAIKANMTYLKERGDFSGSLNTSLRKGKQASFNPEGNSSYNAIDPSGRSGGSTPRGTDLAQKSAASTSLFLFGTSKSLGNAVSQPAHGARDPSQQGQWQSTNAWDLFVPAFTPVYALFDGKVENINFYEKVPLIWGYRFTLFGNTQAFYTHLDVVVKKGAVKKGDLLGYVGQPPSADYSWPPHLHIALKEGVLSTYLDGTGKLL
jgi:murein DD-endopeptidase MepM/ murein hydrolase activator NlpD